MLPDVPTMGEIEPGLNIGTWNGLFVKTGTPQDVKDKIIAVAKEVVMSAPAQKIAEETGARSIGRMQRQPRSRLPKIARPWRLSRN